MQRQRAEQAVATYGLPREVEPAQALLEELHRTAGHVAWLGALVADMETSELKQHDIVSKAGMTIVWEKPAVWLELYQVERKHLARVAKDAIDAGANERVVRAVEELVTGAAERLAGAMNRLADALLVALLGMLRDRRDVAEQVRAAWPGWVDDIAPRELRAAVGSDGGAR